MSNKKPTKSRKTRLNPSKLLVLLLYGNYPYLRVEEMDDGFKELTLKIGPFGRLMRVKNKHIVEYVEWLEEMGFVTIVHKDYYSITVILEVPPLFREVGEESWS